MANAARNVTVGAVALLSAVTAVTPFVLEQEGVVFNGYRDIVGKPTACGGSTRDVVVGRLYTEGECIARIVRDLAEHAGAMAACITIPIESIPDKSLRAFVSFTYNLGPPKFCRSTMLRKLNAGDLAGACAELSRWDKGIRVGELTPRPIAGLTRRRAAERALCEQGLT